MSGPPGHDGRWGLGLLDPPPDWVILDLELPDGSGLTVLETIRNSGLPTRVIVSSATRDRGLIAAFTAYQPDAILPKPVDPALLLGTVTDC